MKNIIEVVKANKKVILKRTLIAVGVITGLTLVGKMIAAKADDEDDIEYEDGDNNASGDNSEE
jgi:hypothetical protein